MPADTVVHLIYSLDFNYAFNEDNVQMCIPSLVFPVAYFCFVFKAQMKEYTPIKTFISKH